MFAEICTQDMSGTEGNSEFPREYPGNKRTEMEGNGVFHIDRNTR